jgi:UDP-glucose:glycoprotein glucosyltransferase
MFPGQLPSVRKDIHNVVIPIDLSHIDDPEIVSETVQSLIRREVPLRWGIVPITDSEISEQHGKILYYLLETYGLAAVMKYLTSVSLHGSEEYTMIRS